MLLELQVKNIALIAEANIEFGPGLTVLTGETGAGKTALLSALKLLIGERGDANFVRDGASEASAEALFSEQTADLATDQVVVRRLTADGRSHCYLDDTMVTVKALAQTIGPLVDLYGQHEHQSLLKPAQQLAALDDFAGQPLAKALEQYQQAWKNHQVAARDLQELEASANNSGVAKEQAAFVLREIAKVDPQVGEYQDLQTQLPVLQNGEELAQATANAVELLRADGQSLDKISAAVSELNALKGIDPQLDKLTARLSEMIIDLEDLALELRSYRDDVEFDAQALQVTLDRLGQLDGLCKRFGPTITDVFLAKQHSEELLGSNTNFEERLIAAQSNLEQAANQRRLAATQLYQLRSQAALEFCKQLVLTVHDLAMPEADFVFEASELAEQNWTLAGSHDFELLYRPSITSKARPLARIASGGELSRVMLALKTMLHNDGSAMTLVFDEIDAGIGGAVATAIAKRLLQLAKAHQVIVVTHLAQIAAKANEQFVVSKKNSKSGTNTLITKVDGEQRVAEIARMLSGSTDKTAIEHARQLLGKSDSSPVDVQS